MTRAIMIFGLLALTAQTATQILEKVDHNQTAEMRIHTVKMIVHGRRGDREIVSKSWVRGDDDAFSEYLSPPREKGTKMLKLGDELWTYYPQTDRIVSISGHMLRQSVMGSDLSYEDYMENPHLTAIYNAVIDSTVTLDERPCWVLRLTAKQDDLAYHSRKLWVDQERYLPLKEERFARSGILLKTTRILEWARTIAGSRNGFCSRMHSTRTARGPSL